MRLTLPTFLTGIFYRFRVNGQSAVAREAGRNHARAMASAYAEGFAEELDMILGAEQQRLIGGEVIEAEAVPARRKVKAR